MKTCPRCSVSTDDFRRTEAYCRSCMREYRRERYAAHPEPTKAHVYAWRAANADKARESQRKSIAAKPAKYRETTRVRMAAWRAANRDAAREADRRWLNCAENLRPACAPCNQSKGATLRKVA